MHRELSLVSDLLYQASLRPLTSLRMLRCFSMEGMHSFRGWRVFQKKLLATQRKMGVASAKFEALQFRQR